MNYRHLISFFLFGLLTGIIATKFPEITKVVLAAKKKPTPISVIGTGGYLQDMSNASFSTNDFSFRDFRNFDFSDSTLEGVNFSNSDLRKAKFTDSTVYHVNFSNANLLGAVGMVITDDIGNPYDDTNWNNTICPDGTNSDNNADVVESGTCIGHL